MRQEYKLTSKKRIFLLSALGIIPFYFELIIYLFDNELHNNNYLKIKQASSLYGILIISFLSGMHWERLISEKKVKFYVLPMIPIIFLWGTLLFSQDTNFNILVIIGLLWCLAFEMFFIETLEQWFIKIRLIVTFFALIPLFLIFFIV